METASAFLQELTEQLPVSVVQSWKMQKQKVLNRKWEKQVEAMENSCVWISMAIMVDWVPACRQ